MSRAIWYGASGPNLLKPTEGFSALLECPMRENLGSLQRGYPTEIAAIEAVFREVARKVPAFRGREPGRSRVPPGWTLRVWRGYAGPIVLSVEADLSEYRRTSGEDARKLRTKSRVARDRAKSAILKGLYGRKRVKQKDLCARVMSQTGVSDGTFRDALFELESEGRISRQRWDQIQQVCSRPQLMWVSLREVVEVTTPGGGLDVGAESA